MRYTLKELYHTIQGEGAQAGRAAVFCRFSGCNLWSGHERNRATAVCRFCDTDFVGTDGPGGGLYDGPETLAAAARACWERAENVTRRFVVCTGGEPLLQLDQPLVNAFHDRGFEVAVETNGTLPVPAGIDWICVSPKAGADLVLRSGHELKLVYPQGGVAPHDFVALPFARFSLQPMDGPDLDRNIELAAEYCRRHPEWHLSLQMHKLLGIP